MTLSVFKKVTYILSFILLVYLVSAWYVVYSSDNHKEDLSKALTSQERIDAILPNDEKGDSFYHIPTGLFLDTFEITSVNKIVIAGKIWQTYPKNFPHQVGFSFDKATSVKPTLIKTKDLGDKTLYLWHFEGTIYEKINVKKFPFDHQISRISITSIDPQKRIVFIPDLNAYQDTSPKSKIGIGDYDLSNYGFNLERTYFTLEFKDFATNFGDFTVVKNFGENVLTYNLILKREILDAALIYFLPFMVILCLLYAILLIVQKWLDRSLSGITALIFTLFLLHRMLRDTFQAAQILYLEYMFITGYLALLFIGFYIIFIFFSQRLKNPDSKRHAVITHLFWPIILISWVLITHKVLM
jgi:hypothetical protein